MNPEEMKLPEMEKSVYSDLSKLFVRKEWVMDPPPFLREILPKEILIDVYRAKLRHLAKVAELESQNYVDMDGIISNAVKR